MCLRDDPGRLGSKPTDHQHNLVEWLFHATVVRYFLTLDIHAILPCPLHYGFGEFGSQLFGAVAEIGLGGAYMSGVGHGILAAFGQAEHGVGKFFSFFCSHGVCYFAGMGLVARPSPVFLITNQSRLMFGFRLMAKLAHDDYHHDDRDNRGEGVADWE